MSSDYQAFSLTLTTQQGSVKLFGVPAGSRSWLRVRNRGNCFCWYSSAAQPGPGKGIRLRPGEEQTFGLSDSAVWVSLPNFIAPQVAVIECESWSM